MESDRSFLRLQNLFLLTIITCVFGEFKRYNEQYNSNPSMPLIIKLAIIHK